MNQSNRLDSVLLLLTGLVILFVALLMTCAKFIPNDGQTFQVISNLLSAAMGALLMRVKHQAGDSTPDTPPPNLLTPPTPPTEVKP